MGRVVTFGFDILIFLILDYIILFKLLIFKVCSLVWHSEQTFSDPRNLLALASLPQNNQVFINLVSNLILIIIKIKIRSILKLKLLSLGIRILSYVNTLRY